MDVVSSVHLIAQIRMGFWVLDRPVGTITHPAHTHVHACKKFIDGRAGREEQRTGLTPCSDDECR